MIVVVEFGLTKAEMTAVSNPMLAWTLHMLLILAYVGYKPNLQPLLEVAPVQVASPNVVLLPQKQLAQTWLELATIAAVHLGSTNEHY
jgi:hypothetical protein